MRVEIAGAEGAMERIDSDVFAISRTREGHSSMAMLRPSDWRAVRPFLVRGLLLAAAPQTTDDTKSAPSPEVSP